MTALAPGQAAAPPAARLRPGDLAGLASIGLRTRKLRASLSALGIAIGVAAIVAVLGLAASAQAGLLAEIARLGTNLLTATNGQTLTGQAAELPDASPGMVGQLRGVTAVQYTGVVSADVYRSPLIPAIDTNGLSVEAASLGLPAAVATSVAQGSYLNAATAREPVAVLGYEAAQLLGIDRIWPGMRIWVGGQWVSVVGILNPATLAQQTRHHGPGRLPRRAGIPRLRRAPIGAVCPHGQHPGNHHQSRQPARRPGQPRRSQRG